LALIRRTLTHHQRGEEMMPQSVLPFKLGITEEKLTAHAGLAIFGEFVHSTGVLQEVDKALAPPGSGVGYAPRRFMEPLMLMLHGGGRSLEDLRVIRQDLVLRDLLRMEEMPSSDAVGDWLRRQGGGDGLEGLAAVNRLVVRRALRRDEIGDYTLDIDATQIVAEKEGARQTYKGERGYMPIVGHLAENGLVLGEEFREGNDSPGARNLEFIGQCVSQMPAGKRISFFRSDSAAYQAAVINWCEENGVRYAIGADLDEAVRGLIAAIPESAWQPHGEGQVAETVHSMNKTGAAFRLVVVRRPTQGDLFNNDDLGMRYTVIASNREESAPETVAWYNQRGDTSENRIKELKIGFGMERLPCGDFGANAMYFRIGALSYNLFVLFKLLALSPEWRHHQVQTVRWRLYQAAGRVVRHGRRLMLRVSAWAYGILEEIRARTREVALAVS
jgi:hypothetical protein